MLIGASEQLLRRHLGKCAARLLRAIEGSPKARWRWSAADIEILRQLARWAE